MRIHGYLSNKSNKQVKPNTNNKRKKLKQQKRKGERTANIDYLHLMSDEQIKKLESGKCTKLLTGKRQRKMMKRIRHAARERNDEVKFDEKASEEEEEASGSKAAEADVEMKEV